MSRAGRTAPGGGLRRIAADLRMSFRIRRQITIHPTETTISKTDATVRMGSTRNSRNGCWAIMIVGLKG